MRMSKEGANRLFLSLFQWHPIDTIIAELADELGRLWIRSHPSIDDADLAIAASALGCPLSTCNVKHFPTFAELKKHYRCADH